MRFTMRWLKRSVWSRSTGTPTKSKRCMTSKTLTTWSSRFLLTRTTSRWLSTPLKWSWRSMRWAWRSNPRATTSSWPALLIEARCALRACLQKSFLSTVTLAQSMTTTVLLTALRCVWAIWWLWVMTTKTSRI